MQPADLTNPESIARVDAERREQLIHLEMHASTMRALTLVTDQVEALFRHGAMKFGVATLTEVERIVAELRQRLVSAH